MHGLALPGAVPPLMMVPTDLAKACADAVAVARQGAPGQAQVMLDALLQAVDNASPADRAMVLEALVSGCEGLAIRNADVPAMELLRRLVRPLSAAGDSPRLFRALIAMTAAGLRAAVFEQVLPCVFVASRLDLGPDVDLRTRIKAWGALGACYGWLGDLEASERYTLQALNAAEREQVPGVGSLCLINLVFLMCSAADRLGQRGMQREADAALWGAERHVRAGEALVFDSAGYREALWRANRAGWLRRVGRLDAARPDYESAFSRAMASKWVDVARHAAHGLGIIATAGGQDVAAETWFDRCIAVSDTLDVYGWVSEAHGELARRQAARGNTQACTHHQRQAALARDRVYDEQRRISGPLKAMQVELLHLLDEAGRARLAEDLQRLVGVSPP